MLQMLSLIFDPGISVQNHCCILSWVELLCPVQPQIYQHIHTQVWWHVQWTRHTHTDKSRKSFFVDRSLISSALFSLFFFLFVSISSWHLCVGVDRAAGAQCLSLISFLNLSLSHSFSVSSSPSLYGVILVWWWYFLHLCTCFCLVCMCHIAIKISLTLGMSLCGYCCLPIW